VPPQYIIAGPQKEKGFLDLALRRHIVSGLPQYQHKLVEAPFQRLELMLKSDPNACVMGLFRKPEREQFMWFSRPFLAQFPPGILIRQALRERVAPYLNEQGKLSLRKLLDAGELKVGVGGARSYGAVIDGLLKPHIGEANMYVNSAGSAATGLLQMATIGRIDAVPGFPYEAQYLGIDPGRDGGALVFYPLAEQPEFLLGHAACARTEFGGKVIREVDAILQQPGVRQAIADYYASWLDAGTRKLEKELRKHAVAQ
jgi:uncharacterized protein (TIGR02285 family)